MNGHGVGFLAIVAVIGVARCSPSPAGPDLAPAGEPRTLQPTIVNCDSAEDIRARIDDLESDGTLNHGQATAVRAKLNQAERHEGAGRSEQAAEAYARLIAQVEEWVDTGVLTEEEAMDLLACAEDVLDGPHTGPVIDGIKSPDEWGAAVAVAVFTGATFYAMNDDENLYIAFEVSDPTLTNDIFEISFDNTLDGVNTVGDDVLVVTLAGLADGHFGTHTANVRDTQQDGTAAVGASGGVNFFELAHPLDSGDPNDFALSLGSDVGYCLRYFLDGIATSLTSFPRTSTSSCLTTGDQSLYAVLSITAP